MTQAIKLKYCLTSSDSGTWGDDADGVNETPVLRSTEISLAGSVDPSHPARRALSQHERHRTRLRAGDILVVRSSGSDQHLGKAGYVSAAAVGLSFSNFLQRLRFSPSYHSRFAWYFLNSTAAKQQIRKLSSTTTGLQNLSATLISELEIPSPSWEEQRRIADFLDAETARIDQLTAAMVAQDDLLKHRRLRVLDSVRGRDHQQAQQAQQARLGYLSTLVTSGSRGWSEHVSDTGELFFRSANLYPDNIQPKLANTAYVQVPELEASEARRARIKAGDVLIGITGANAGWVCLADNRVASGYVSQHVCLVRPASHQLDGQWLALLVASPSVQGELLGNQYGGTKTQLSLPDVRAIQIPRIPVEHQLKNARSVNRQIEVIDRQRALRLRQLGVLAERRQALITAAVTGQFDVSTASGRNVTDGVPV